MSAPETLYVPHGLPHLAARLRELGATKVLVLAPPSRRHVADVVAALAAFAPEVFDGAAVHVPADVVDAAAARLVETGADTIVAVGGGAPIGLGKALRRAHRVRFAAIPTTYAGSEQTTMFGITRGQDKVTGRDDAVRPDVVLYDVELTRTLPLALTVQSLWNALAHVIGVLATGSLAAETDVDEALAAAAKVVRAADDLLLAPGDRRARADAQHAAAACAALFERSAHRPSAPATPGLADRGRPSVQHGLAHLLGGGLGVAHAALHALLLPQLVAHLRATHPAIVEQLAHAVGRPDLDAYLHDTLVRAGAPVSLAALGAAPAAVAALLATRPELPAAIAHDAQYGLRPPGRGGRVALGDDPPALLAGPPPEAARRVILALHGRGAEAGTIVRRVRELVGHDPATCVLGLRAPGGADRWYAVRYGEPGAGADPEVERAIARVAAALGVLAERAPGARRWVAGFSQGACLALEVAARHGAARGLAGVIAPCGARIGRPDEWAAPAAGALAGAAVVLGAAAGDAWIAQADVAATAAWFAAAGAEVDTVTGQGDRHEITLGHRLAARARVLGAPPAGAIGFGNAIESEALPGALPPVQSSPRLPPYGLYAEQLSGTGFTAPRDHNRRTWVYRVRPSTQRRPFVPLAHPRIAASFDGAPEVNLCGFAPLALPRDGAELDFVDGLVTLCGAGSPALRRGYAVYRYAANRSMERRAFYSADGDLLIIPDTGALVLVTELGPLALAPGHIAILPRGVVFAVLLREPTARGYVAEAFGRHFRLPDRGPIGANGLADARHFRAPSAWYEDRLAPDTRVVAKLGGRLHEASQDHSPFDVVAWHGNYAPVTYDLDAFSPSGNVRFDHGDPSIHTVVSAPLDEAGTHALDLVVFPPRVDPTTGTFRPAYFHRNTTTEINGIIRESGGGANRGGGSPFQPGMCFVTPQLTAHGVGGRTVDHLRALDADAADRPARLTGGSLWFQLETALPPVLAPWTADARLPDWHATWASCRSYFSDPPGER